MVRFFINNALILIILFAFKENSVAQLCINEVQYENNTTLTDADGDTPDWIEIYNTGCETINLAGYKLSDDSTLANYWVFPKVLIEADRYQFIFASDKDKQASGEIHTDFKLKLMSEPLYLMDCDGKIIDKIEVQCIPPDKSLGYLSNGKGVKGILSPTPGFSNNEAQRYEIKYQPEEIFISHESGLYNQALDIHIDKSHEKNEIRYTLNGDEPKMKSKLYENSIHLDDISNNENRFANKVKSDYRHGNLISKGNILRARIFSEGCPASKEISNTYFISTNNTFDYNVPLVSIITEKDNLFDDEIGIYTKGNYSNFNQHGKKWERNIHIEIFDQDGQQFIDQNAGVRIHGRGSRAANQKSFRLYAREEYGKEYFNHSFFTQKPNTTQYKTLLLRSTREWSGTLFKDELCQHLISDMNLDFPAAETVIVFLNGEYWGIYSMHERHDKHYVSTNYNIAPPDLDIIGYDHFGVVVESGDQQAYNELLEYLEKSNPQSKSFYTEINRLMDIDALIDFYIAEIYLANSDFPNNNLELWKTKNDTSRWRYFFFDMDGAMIRANYDHLLEYNNSYIDLQRYEEHSTYILKNIMANPQFRKRFNSRFTYHLGTTFSPTRVNNLIDHYTEMYKPLISEHIYRWNNPSDFNKWFHNVSSLKSFAVQRPVFISEKLKTNFGNPFSLYPNPSKGVFNIDLGEVSTRVSVKIYNITGNLVYHESYSSNGLIQYNNHLPKGMYVIQLIMNNHTYFEQLILE